MLAKGSFIFYKSVSFKKLFNMSLRVLTLLLKFFLVIHISKNLGDEALAKYGVDFAFIMLFKFILGGELYLFFNKKYAKHGKFDFILIHVFMVLVLYSIFILSFSFFDYSYLFIFLIFLEHFSQETYRYLIAIKKPNLAGYVLFIRSGGWVGVYLLYFNFFSTVDDSTLNDVYLFWTLGCLLSILVSFYPLVRNKVKDDSFLSLSKHRVLIIIKQALKLCCLYLMVAICFRGVIYADRYFVSELFSSKEAAAYIFFFSISSSVYAFIESGVFSYRISDLYKSNSLEEKKKGIKNILIESLLVSLVFSVVTYLLLPYLLKYMDKEYYEAYINIFLFLMAFNVIFSLSQMLSFGLIVRNKNLVFMLSGVIFFISYFIIYILIKELGVLTINTMPIPLLVSSFIMLLLRWKYFFYAE